MKRSPKKILQEILPETEDEGLSDLMEALMDTEMDIELVQPPEAGLMMMTIRDCFEIPFYLGEVLVTRAEVRIEDAVGYGCCMGDRPRAALALAILEVLQEISGELPSSSPVMTRLTALAETVSDRREKASRLTALTRVEFQSMAEE
ncbi:MAG: phosphonate C-P lyase system protein PhnG [Desulfobacteraceae bacterium]|nr:phosphonate C-P lyase system protein PhnG [Desulfobacteraceae bacterium]